MKAILLAAGKGTRISRNIEKMPKSILPIEGIPLIRMTAELLHSKGMEVSVCIGYEHNKIRDVLIDMPIKYYYNPFYNVTNSIGSLWLAQQELEGDNLLIMNADVFLTDKVLDLLLNDERKAVMLADKTRTAVGDYFFNIAGDGSICAHGKDLPLERRTCEYVGAAKICKAFVPRFKDRLNELVESQRYNLWWENILYSFAERKEEKIFTRDVESQFWSEIDYVEDYERIKNHMLKQGNEISGE